MEGRTRARKRENSSATATIEHLPAAREGPHKGRQASACLPACLPGTRENNSYLSRRVRAYKTRGSTYVPRVLSPYATALFSFPRAGLKRDQAGVSIVRGYPRILSLLLYKRTRTPLDNLSPLDNLLDEGRAR